MSTALPLFAVTSTPHRPRLGHHRPLLRHPVRLGLVGHPPGKDTADDYFLAGRNLAGSSSAPRSSPRTSAPSTSSGLAGSGATDGVAMAHYELHAWCLLVLAWVLVPFYMRSMVFTMPEFLERRFSPARATCCRSSRWIAFIISKIAVGIFAGGVVFGDAAAGDALNARRRRHRQLLDRLDPRAGADRPLHDARRHARRRLHRSAADRSSSSSARRC